MLCWADVSNSDSENSDSKTATEKQRLTHNSDPILSDCQNSDLLAWAILQKGDQWQSDYKEQRSLQSRLILLVEKRKSLAVRWMCICKYIHTSKIRFVLFRLRFDSMSIGRFDAFGLRLFRRTSQTNRKKYLVYLASTDQWSSKNKVIC